MINISIDWRYCSLKVAIIKHASKQEAVLQVSKALGLSQETEGSVLSLYDVTIIKCRYELKSCLGFILACLTVQ